MPRLTEQEQQEIIGFIEAGKPLPEQYRSVLFNEKPEAEERFRLITESIYDCVSLVDTSGVYQYVSPSYSKTLGYAPEELIGRNGFSITHPDDLERIFTLYVERMEKGYNEIKYETRLLHRDGHYVPMEVTTLAINSPQGKLTGGVLVARDITERKQAEESLQRQLKYEQAIALASTCLLNHEGAPHKTVHDALACLREATDASRVYIFENSDDPAAGLCAGLTHEACAPGVPSEIDNPLLQHMPYSSGMERWRELLSKGIPIWGNVCDFPESERINLEPQGIISIMVLPLFSGGRWHGFVGFDETLTQRKWQPADVALLKTAADMIGIFMAHIRTQETLRESRERYYGVYKTAPIAFVLWDRACHITDWNRHAEKTFGWSREEALGRNFLDLILPESARASVEDVVTRLLEGLLPSRSINENITKDGSIILCEWNNTIQYDSRGEVAGVLSLALDITERRRAEEELLIKNQDLKILNAELTATGERMMEALEKLNAKEEQYAFIASNVLDIIAYTDRVGNYKYVSPSCRYVLGYSLEDLKTIAGYKINHPEDVSRVKGAFASAIKRKGTRLRYETRLRHKDGHYIPFEVFGKIFYDSDDDYSSFLLTGRDITERKKAEENNEKLQAQLAQAQKMESVGRLAGGVAHDLNNVLSGIVSYPELILMNLPEDSKLRKPLKAMMESGLQAAAIVQDLLTLARGVATANEPLNLNNLIREYLSSPECDMLKQHHRAITIKTGLDSSLLNIGGSPVHVRKVIMNVVSNAAEAIKESGNITIATANRYIDRPLQGYHEIKQGEYAVLSVADDGHGISPDDLERIFEPFYTKKKLGRSGTGLGLAVVWNVMQDHKGYIDVKTGENGTIFELYFPITRDAVLKKDLPLSVDACKGNGEKILFVDDEESQREISCKILDALGYKATSVSSGEEAIEYLKNNAVDLVVLDMIMEPGISGHETYKQIIQIHPAQKAIIVSGFSETDDVKDIQMLGAGKYIKKPLTIEKIGVAIKEELEQ